MSWEEWGMIAINVCGVSLAAFLVIGTARLITALVDMFNDLFKKKNVCNGKEKNS